MTPPNPKISSPAFLENDYRRKFRVTSTAADPETADVAKRRRTHLKACDPCCKRKIRCEDTRPCKHCVAQLLQCTDSRQRKKSGPKDTHPTILNSINSLGNVLDQSPLYLSGVPSRMLEGSSHLSSTSPAQSLCDSTSPGLQQESDSDRFYKPSLALLIENLDTISNEPIVLELLRPLTVQLLVISHGKHVQFLHDLLSPGMDLDDDIRIMEFHQDSVALSRLMLIFTLNLIISEIFIKLKKQKFRDFAVYPKRNLLFRNYKNYKSLCHFKCIEIMALLEKNFIVPSVVPQKLSRGHGLGNAMLGSMHQVHYNLSLSFLHLCNYYHMMNLTNTLNHGPTARDPDHFSFGNESQEQHKLVNLQKSIAYFELILVKRTGGILAMAVQLYELFEAIFTTERFFLLFLSGSYAATLMRNNDVLVKLDSRRLLRTRVESMDLLFSPNSCFDIVHAIHRESASPTDDLLAKLSRSTGFSALPAVSQSPHDCEADAYMRRKAAIDLVAVDSPILQVLKCILVFKLVLTHCLDMETIEREIIAVVTRLSHLLKDALSDLFTLQVSNYQALPPMLHILKIVLQYRAQLLHHVSSKLLVDYSDLLIGHFGLFNNISKLIRSARVLNNWFVDLKSVRDHVLATNDLQGPSHHPLDQFPQQQQQQQQQHQQHQQQQPQQPQQQQQAHINLHPHINQSALNQGDLVPATVGFHPQSQITQSRLIGNKQSHHPILLHSSPGNHAASANHDVRESPGAMNSFLDKQSTPNHNGNKHVWPGDGVSPVHIPRLNIGSSDSRSDRLSDHLSDHRNSPYALSHESQHMFQPPMAEASVHGLDRNYALPSSLASSRDHFERMNPHASGPPAANSSFGHDSTQATPLVHLAAYSPAMNPAHDHGDPDVGDALDEYRQQQEYAQYVAQTRAENVDPVSATNDLFYTSLVLRLGANGPNDGVEQAPRPASLGANHSNLSSTANMANAYIAMSESTKNLYNFFTKLGDHGLRCTSMTNLNQMAEYYGEVGDNAEDDEPGTKFYI